MRSPSLVFYMIDSSHIKPTLPAHAGQPVDESQRVKVAYEVVRARRDQLAQLLTEHQYLPLAEVCSRLSISEATARRDLTALEREHAITRTYGGAVGDYNRRFDSFRERLAEAAEPKRRIAVVAMELIKPRTVLYLDGGTTVHAVAEALAVGGPRPLTVVTNNLMVAERLSEVDGIEMNVLGGQYLRRQAVILGPKAQTTAKLWRYEKFSGQIGKSDIVGTLEVDVHTHRPMLTGSLHSNKLNFADLGPLVGAKKGNVAVVQSVGQGRVLPSTPFRTERWDKMDADVTLTAASIVRNEALPINNLSTHLHLNNALLTLDPLKLGVAGGTLGGLVKLDGRTSKIKASTDLKARRIRIAELFPTLDKTHTSIGLVNGDIDLKGSGNTIASMLGSADGRLALVVNQGEISKFMMEAVGLHLLEMLQLTIAGDKNVQINCGVADFGVKNGVMTPNMLMLDTDVTRINSSGVIDLDDEKLDLIIIQKSKKLSLVSLRPPIHIRGNFAKPNISLDKSKLATRGLGAVALGIVNPLLALLPLIEPGKDKDADCGRLISETKMPAKNITRTH